MNLNFSKKFRKELAKQTASSQRKFKDRVSLLLNNPLHPILRNHPLHGTYEGYRSINVTGDIRAIFKQDLESILFVDIGTHSELYS